MRFRLTPRDESFFELFTRTGEVLVEAAAVLTEFLGSDQVRRVDLARRMEEIEHSGDEAAHAVLRRLHTSFVTPFDREDIHRLASRLDDCLDLMHAAVDLILIYRVGDLPPAVGDLVQVIARQAELTCEALPRLNTPRALSDYWVEVNRLENQADQIHRGLLTTILGGEHDAITVLKLKEVVEKLESTADAFEDVAHAVELIAIKES
ncbi:DUF47 family protein [Paenibacillus sp. TRM 82003]|uniref:DUF47 domain-containing protein n=1 Tax=Kineococcus sp. TRM81007 TaxID=2925831 RepID=UPI001F56C17D|nr:DUF47 family protein [Kineococcus sp. TRM81007]MCI2238629.1 DUF47 family protein [Kineococcus sp. TRM81007]MCI3927291.1 DUF47 family protein [Paenibacillus sp. TRM 82003]